MHVEFIYKWSFWDGFRTFPKLFSSERFREWIFIEVSTLFHIAQGQIPHRITHILGATRLLAMTKPSGVEFIPLQ
jgi:hypothetical protein